MTAVVVTGSKENPPPGIDALSGRAEIRFAGSAGEAADAFDGARVALLWDHGKEVLEAGWESARELQWVQASSAGVDAVLFPALVESEVRLTNARGIFDESIAECVIGLLLAFVVDLPGILDRQRERRWEHRYTDRLGGSSLLVLGAGSIGRAIGRKAAALGMRVRAVARTSRSDGVFGEIAGIESLRELLGDADYVVNALPLTPQTRHLVGTLEFAAMKPSARFVNIGRGATVDEPALVAALQEGVIAGAALDVFEEEPLPASSPLWAMPNVIVLPHMSGDFRGNEVALVDLFLENFDRFEKGEPLLNLVDKRLGYPPST
jgi:phosphoglycerate dehydrogenase-like enzyme